MKKIRITEGALRRIVKESVKKVLKESYYSGGEYYEDQEEMYIGRTSAYYDDDDDDSIYTPDYWTYDEDPNYKQFAGEVYALNADGISELNWWLECQRSNEYQRRNTFNHNNMSGEEMWEHLTDPRNHLSKLIRK